MMGEPFVRDAEAGVFWIEPWREKFRGIAAGITSRTLDPCVPFGNFAFHVGDDPANVMRNRRRLCELLGVGLEEMTCALQPHGNEVVAVTEANRGAGAEGLETAIPGADGLVTNLSGTLLALFYADCVPIYFYDPVRKAIGLAHAGWRGTVKNIAGKMVQKLQDTYQSNADKILAAIGPSIGPCCYQVDEEVAERVKEAIPRESDQVLMPEGNGRYRLDLQKMNRILLEKAGILSQHIEITNRCTSCQNDLFFSHRKERGRTGRIAAFILLKGELR